MTEEDQYGYTMPDRYRCDACKATVFHLGSELKKKQPKSRRLKSWEYTDVFEETCKNGFQGYGIKLIDGENALSGPGLPKNQESMAAGSGAIMMSSDNWNKRLGEVCRKLVFEKIGEEEIYEMLYNKMRVEDPPADWAVDLSESFCTKEVRDCTTGPKMPPPSKSQDSEDTRPRPRPREKKPKVDKAGIKTKKEEVKPTKESPPKPGGKVDVQTFMRRLATQHGFTSDEYLATRTPKEWEKLLLALGSRMLEDKSEEI